MTLLLESGVTSDSLNKLWEALSKTCQLGGEGQ